MPSADTGTADIHVEGNTIVADLSGWDGNPSEIEGAESEWLSHADQSQITGSIVAFSEDLSLSSETQEHITAKWSELADSAGIEKNAYVSEGIKAMAVSANLDAAGEIQTFDTLEEALNWTQN